MTNNTFIPAQHARGKDKPAGQAPGANRGGFVTMDPNTDALSAVSAGLAGGHAADRAELRGLAEDMTGRDGTVYRLDVLNLLDALEEQRGADGARARSEMRDALTLASDDQGNVRRATLHKELDRQAVIAAKRQTVDEAARDVIDMITLPQGADEDAKFPTATEIQIWNAGEDEGESSFEVEEIRDAAGKVLWRCDTGVETAFEYEVNGYALGLDRFGIDALAQRPGSGGAPWTGLVVADRPADTERSEPNAEISSMLARDTATVRDAKVNVAGEVSAAFSTATEIQIWNAGEDEGESSFEVERIRDAAGKVLWSKDRAADYNSPFAEKVNGWAIELDRFGIDALAQKPGSGGAPWTGIVVAAA